MLGPSMWESGRWKGKGYGYNWGILIDIIGTGELLLICFYIFQRSKLYNISSMGNNSSSGAL